MKLLAKFEIFDIIRKNITFATFALMVSDHNWVLVETVNLLENIF